MKLPKILHEAALTFVQLGTAYTIIFMTTIATLFKRFALWKAQEGATVAELEQYQASISLPGTLKMIVLLRAFSWTSAGLLLLWSWFYLGSQAVSREYAAAASPPFGSRVLLFPSAEALSIFEASTPPTNVNITMVNAAFMGAMQVNSQTMEERSKQQEKATKAGDKNQISKNSLDVSDTFNAALIPLMETYPDSGLGPKDVHGVRQVDEDGIIEYSANAGVPVLMTTRKIHKPGDCQGHGDECAYFDFHDKFMGKYSLSTSYIFPNCSDVIYSGPEAFPQNALNWTTFINPTNHTVGDLPTVDIWERDYPNTNKTVRGRCTLARHFVDVVGNCDTLSCGIQSFGYTKGKGFSSETLFKNPERSKLFFDNLMKAAGIPDESEAQLSSVLWSGLLYTNISFSSFESNTSTMHWDSYKSYDGASIQLALSQNLAYIINTYMTASQLNGGLYSPATVLDSMSLDDQKALLANTKTTGNSSWGIIRANGAPVQATYILVVPWIILDFMTCFILLLAAIVSVWLRLRTVCPDVFGYISSMTRDNPHIPVPVGGSTMSGIERARAMKNVRVKIGEVERQDGTPGHIGLALEHPEIPLDKLRRKGEYL